MYIFEVSIFSFLSIDTVVWQPKARKPSSRKSIWGISEGESDHSKCSKCTRHRPNKYFVPSYMIVQNITKKHTLIQNVARHLNESSVSNRCFILITMVCFQSIFKIAKERFTLLLALDAFRSSYWKTGDVWRMQFELRHFLRLLVDSNAPKKEKTKVKCNNNKWWKCI